MAIQTSGISVYTSTEKTLIHHPSFFNSLLLASLYIPNRFFTSRFFSCIKFWWKCHKEYSPPPRLLHFSTAARPFFLLTIFYQHYIIDVQFFIFILRNTNIFSPHQIFFLFSLSHLNFFILHQFLLISCFFF